MPVLMSINGSHTYSSPSHVEYGVNRAQHFVDSVDQPVMDLAPTLLASDETAAPETVEVLGDVGLAESGRRDQVGDAPLVFAQFLEDAQARRIREPVEQVRLQLNRMGFGEHAKSITKSAYVSSVSASHHRPVTRRAQARNKWAPREP